MNDKKTLVGLNITVFLMMLGVGMIVALLPQRILSLTSDSAQVGYLASAFALSYIVLQVPIGNLADRYGFKLFLVIGYSICCLTGIIYYFSNSASLIFLGRMFQGAGEAPVWALAPALLSIKYPLARARVMGVYNASLHLGLTLGPLIGVLLADLLRGNQIFLVYAGLCLLSVVMILFSVENTVRFDTPQTMNVGHLFSLVKNKDTAIVLAGIALYGVGYGAFLTNIPAFLIDIKQFTQTQVGIFFSLFYVAVSVSQMITGPLSDRFGRKLFMMFGLYLSAGALFLFSRFELPGALILLTVASLGLGVLCLSSMAFLNETVSNSLKGTISGAYYFFWGIGFFFGPILLGRLGALPGDNQGFFLLALCLVAEAILMMIRFRRPGKRELVSVPD